jgi:cytochrome c5
MKKRIFALTATAALLLAACGQQEEATQSTTPAAPAESAPPQAIAAAPEAPVNPVGKKVYGMTCSMCHASGAAGAPIPGNQDDWGPRIAQGMDLLYQHSLEGFTGEKGMMPAKGGNPSLSDEDTKAAVDYMVELSR